MLSVFFARLFSSIVMIALYLVGRPLKSPHSPEAPPCHTTPCNQFGAGDKGPLQARGVAFRGFTGARLAAPVICWRASRQGQWSRLDGKRSGHGSHTACDSCPITCVQGWGFLSPTDLEAFKRHVGLRVGYRMQDVTRPSREFLEVKVSLSASWLFVLHPQGPYLQPIVC